MSSECSTPSAKRARYSGTGDGQMDAMAESVRRHNHRRQMDCVIEAMSKDPELTSNLAYVVETGRLARRMADGDAQLPTSCNKWSMIKVDMKRRICSCVFPDIVGDEPNAKAMQKADKNIWNTLLQLGLHVDLGSAVYSKNVSQLIRTARLRHLEIQNSPLHALKGPVVEVDLKTHGVYRLNFGEDGKATTVQHVIARVTASLVDIGHTIDSTWELTYNADVLKARLGKGKLSMLVYKLFDKELCEAPFFRPEILARVPGVSGKSASSSDSGHGREKDDDGKEVEGTGDGQHEAVTPPTGNGGVEF